MMDANAAFEKWKHHGNLRQLLIFSAESFDCIAVNLAYRLALILCVKVAVLEGHGELLALSLAERENDARVQTF